MRTQSAKLTAHGEDPYAVLPLLMTYMGHRSVQATSQYIHLSAESFPAILKQSEALFGNLIPLEDISKKHPSDSAICISNYLTKSPSRRKKSQPQYHKVIQGHLLPAFTIYEGDEQKDRQDLLGRY